ncbi:MAG: trypsin-like peptidase domain-containing protein [Candidatus Paceibacterota bacterium]
MPIFALIQVLISRIVITVIAVLSVVGIGSFSEAPQHLVIEEKPVSIQEETTLPIDGVVDIRELSEESLPDPEESKPKEAVSVPIAEETVEVPVTIPIQEVTVPLSFSQINTDTAKTLVNVLCTQNSAGAAHPITGSGVIIDPRGVVITNAHVAQFFLLKDHPVENALQCTLRTGSPARNTYTAELLYISPEWVRLHASDINNTAPKGTGEYDYALLRITGRTDPQAQLPATFPFVSIGIHDESIQTGDQALVAAYPAGFLGGVSIQRDLFSVSSVATIGERFTFLENTIDLISVGGTVVSQGGSSGGAVVSQENTLIGIIVTSTQADTTAERDLRAITTGYINRSLIENENTTIEGLLFGDVLLKARLFNLGVAPALTALFLPYLVQ